MSESEDFGGAGIVELTGKIMVVAIFLLLFIVAFVFCIHLYAKYFWYRRRENPNSAVLRRLDFTAEHQEIAVLRRGLEPSILKTLPVLIFDPKDFEDGLECAVCISEISTGQQTRLLPKCSHGFHLECIDMWFESHSTCPLCRNPVKTKTSSEEPPSPEAAVQAPAAEVLPETPNFPTNVLIWGDETQVSTSALCVEETNNSNAIVIEPSSTNGARPPQSGSSDVEDDSEHKLPMATWPRAFKGLLGYNNRKVNPSSSMRNSDIEQGGTGQS